MAKKKPQKTNIEKSKWIEIYFSLDIMGGAIPHYKAEFKALTEELTGKWVVEVDKEGYIGDNGERYYNFLVKPKSGRISPEDYRADKDKIVGYAYALYAENCKRLSEEEQAETYFYRFNYESPKKVTDYEKIRVIEQFSTLHLMYKMVDVIRLENQSPNMAKAIFDYFIVDKIDDVLKVFSFFEKISKKDAYASLKKECELLHEYYGFEIDR